MNFKIQISRDLSFGSVVVLLDHENELSQFEPLQSFPCKTGGSFAVTSHACTS